MTVPPREPELIDYLEVLWRWKRLIISVSVVAMLSAIAVWYFRHPSYRAEATIVVSGADMAAALADPRITIAAGGVTIERAADNKMIRMSGDGASEVQARESVTAAINRVTEALRDQVDVASTNWTGAREEQRDLSQLLPRLRESRQKSFSRDDALSLLTYQAWTGEIARVEARLAGLIAVVNAPKPQLTVTPVAVTTIRDASLRLLLVVALFGGVVLAALVALLVDYVSTEMAARKAAVLPPSRSY